MKTENPFPISTNNSSVTGFLAIALLALGGGCTRSDKVATSSESNGGAWIEGTGYVEPTGETRRLVFDHAGVVAECLVNVGQTVTCGSLLVCLRSGDEHAAVDEANAGLSLARAEAAQIKAGANPAQIQALEARADFARKTFGREEALLRAGSVAQAEYDQAEADRRRTEAELQSLRENVRSVDRDVADARIRMAEAHLATALEHLKETELRAPFRGTVLEILRREGETVNALGPEAVVIFGDLSHLRVRAEIDETYAMQVRLGQRIEVRPRGSSGRWFASNIVLVNPVMGRKTVFAQSATERRDLDVIQVLADIEPGANFPVGLEVDVRVNAAR